MTEAEILVKKLINENGGLTPELIQRFELPPELTRHENLKFIAAFPLDGSNHLEFEIPELAVRGPGDHYSDVYLSWFGPDPSTWDVEGIRWEVIRVWDNGEDENLVSSDIGPNEKTNQLDDLLDWLDTETD